MTCLPGEPRAPQKSESSADDERFRLFYECSPLGYQSLDADGRILDINPAWLDLLGYQREHVLGRSFSDFMTPSLRKSFPQRFAHFKKSGQVSGAEWDLVSCDGRTICIELDGRASYDEEGGFLRSHCVLRDITVRKQEEQRTRALASAALDLVELSPEADLFRFVAERVRALAGKAIVSVSTIEGDKLTVRSVFGASHAIMKLAERLMGSSVIDMPFDGVHEQARRDLLTGRLIEVEGGLYELFFRTVPQPVCWTLEKAIGLTRCHSIGLRHGERLLGNVTILSQNGTQLNSGIIEAFVNQASIALERRGVQEALRESEEKHRLLLNHAPLGIGYYDLKGRVILLNEVAAAHMGGRAEDYAGTSLEQLFGPENASLYLRRILTSSREGTSQTYEDRVELPSGERWFRSTYAPQVGANGYILGVQIMSDDITHIKQAQRELQTAHRFLLTVLDSSPGNVAVLASDGTIAMFNDAWRSFGLANGLAPEWLDRSVNYLETCRQARGPWSDEAPKVAEALEAILEDRSSAFEIEYPCHSPNEKRWFRLQIQGFTYDAVRWAVLSHIDITSRVKAEESLRESEQRFRLVTETIQDVFWMSTPGVTEQLYVSPAYETLWGRSIEELRRDPRAFIEGVHPADRDRLIACIRTHHADGRRYRCQYRVVRPDGQIRWVLERGFPVLEDGVCRKMAGVCTDITEHKQAQWALTRNKALLDATGHVARVGGWEIDASTQEVTWTQEIYRIHEVPLGSMPSLEQALDFFPPEERERLSQALRMALEDGIPYDMELRFTSAKGKRLWVRTICHPQFVHGKTVRLLGTFQDITAAKEAQDALEKEAAMRGALLDSIPNCYAMILRKDSREIVASNRSAREIGAVPGQTCYRMCADREDTCPFCQNPMLWESGQPQRLEVEYRGAWYEGIWVPLSDELYVHYIFDITERKLAEAALQESEAKYRTVVEDAKEGILIIQAGRRAYYNPRWLEFTGYSAVEYDKMPFLSLVHPEDRRRLRKLYNDFVGGHDPTDPLEFRLVTESGQVRWLDAKLSRIEWENRPATMLFLEDITERRSARAKLDAYQKQLQSLAMEFALAGERERRRIGLGLHDHVGQSLAMTKLAVQSLGRKADVATGKALEDICDRIDGQIEAIRSLSFELSDSVLYEVGFKEAVDAYLMREVKDRHGIAYRLDAQEGFGGLPDDIKVMLFRNLRELLTNVVKHAQAKYVEVGLTAGRDCYMVTVRDDGVGFDPATVFAGHEREHYGLFSVKEQLGFFRGWLDIRSAPGEGTIMMMTLPGQSVE